MFKQLLLIGILSLTGIPGFAQGLIISALEKEIIYKNDPVIIADVYPENFDGSDIFGTSFSIIPSAGRVKTDSVNIFVLSEGEYSLDYLSIDKISPFNLSYSITGIRPGFEIEEKIEYIRFSIPLEGLTEADTIIDLRLEDINSNDLYGNRYEVIKGADQVKLVKVVPGSGLKVYYNTLDQSATINFPDYLPPGEMTIRVIDLAGRTVQTGEIYEDLAKIGLSGLAAGVYIIELTCNHLDKIFRLTEKIAIPCGK